MADEPSGITATDGYRRIRAQADYRADIIGTFRAGQTIPLRQPDVVLGAGCPDGWYAVEPRGFVCDDAGAELTSDGVEAKATRHLLPRNAA